jgi:probable F420-dependent oxidoreductase
LKFGVCIPNYGESLSVETMRSVALESERLGYDSIWATDHILMPKNSSTPYEQIFDSLATLAYLAGQTQRVRLGISSLIIAMRNPVEAAKQLATIDRLSGGRMTMLAIGAGWNEQEFSFLGYDYHTRGKRVDESIRLIRSLWAGAPSFDGRFFRFSDASFEPRPVEGRLAVWVGGTSRAAMRRAATLGDAWHPNVLPLDSFGKMVAEFRSVSPEARDKPICVRIGLNVRAERSEYVGPRGDRRILLSGDSAENERILSELERLGVEYAVLVTSPDGRQNADEQVEGLKTFAREFLGKTG